MDILILLIGVAFLALIGAAFFIFFKEPKETVKKKIPTTEPQADVVGAFNKKISQCETKIKSLEYDLEASRLELAQTKEKEKALLSEKSRVVFDREQYEKFKKEHQLLKQELTGKEEMLEKEISSRRREASELAQTKIDLEALKKRVIESEDAYRKSRASCEALSKELSLAKKTIEDQKRIVNEHTVNKIEGEWVSRIEFNKLERELKEKEALLQKYLRP